MFKLTAVVRNHFVVVPNVKAEAPSPRTSGPTLVSILKRVRFASRCINFIVPKLLAALRKPMPDSSMMSLAGKAPTVCPQLPRIGR
jgi:hypothetical protein